MTFFVTGQTDIRTDRLFSENIILEAFLTFFFIFIPLCEFFSLFAYIPTKCKRPLLLLPDRSIDARRIKKKQESLVGDIQKLREQKWDFFGMCMQLDCNCFESEIVHQEGLKNYKILST